MNGNAPQERVKQLAQLVARHMTLTRDFRDAHQSAGPAEGSPLSLELDLSRPLPWGAAGVASAVSIASLKLMIAA
jgi:hypothetical protein